MGTDNNSGSSPPDLAIVWGIAALGGVLACILLYSFSGMGITGAVVCAAVLAFFVGLVLTKTMTGPLSPPIGGQAASPPAVPAPDAAAAPSGGASSPAESEAPASAAPAAAAGSAAAVAPASAPEPETKAAPAPEPAPEAEPAPKPKPKPKADTKPASPSASAAPAVSPSKPMPGEADLAARDGSWRYDPAASGDGSKPEGLTQAREGGADDLKLIKGIGPKLEKLLHSLGFYHFDQIAAWTDTEVAWVDQNLEGFKGRVTRDAWVAQARELAKG